jgi:predicted phage terminase large subunit-like protein
LILEELERRRAVDSARANLLAFAEYATRGHWQRAAHLELLAGALERVAAGEILRLIIEIPPRHGKSELSSVHFPTWFLGNNPDKRVILGSYAAELAEGFGRRVRNALEDIGPELWGLTVADDSSARGRWDIADRRGGMYAVGVGGPITGRGADLLIIDDPVKNSEEANSKAKRDSQWEWWQTTARTRLEPNGAVIVIMTRWHEDDLVGRLLAEGDGEKWHRIRLPAIAEQEDPLCRSPGEALWPARFDEAALAAIETDVGSYTWAALYQQRPMPATGNKFKRSWFRYFEVQGDHVVLHAPESGPKRYALSQCWCFQTCDPAGSTKASADWFALGTWLVTPDKDLLLRDVLRERLEGPDQPRLFRQSYERWRPQPQFQSVETKNMGLTLFQTLRRDGLPVRELRAETDKVTRALPVAARMESGSVYLLRGAPWLGEYEAELLMFPNGQYDDQVDITSYAGIIIAGRAHTNPGAAPKHPAW